MDTEVRHREMSNTETACELIAALLKGPRTQKDAAAMSGMSLASVSSWFAALKGSGLLSKVGRVGAAELWDLNPYPFMARERALPNPGRRVYLAGPMTGLPELNFPAFHAQAHALRLRGYEVENPAENPMPDDPCWRNYMRLALAQLVSCDTVALLPGWERSRGAQIEARVGRDLGLQVVMVDELQREEVAA